MSEFSKTASKSGWDEESDSESDDEHVVQTSSTAKPKVDADGWEVADSQAKKSGRKNKSKKVDVPGLGKKSAFESRGIGALIAEDEKVKKTKRKKNKDKVHIHTYTHTCMYTRMRSCPCICTSTHIHVLCMHLHSSYTYDSCVTQSTMRVLVLYRHRYCASHDTLVLAFQP